MRASFRAAPTLLLLCTAHAAVMAAEWRIDPAVSFRAGYSDNLTLRANDEIETGVATLSPSARFSVATPRSEVSGEVDLAFRRYTEDSDLNDEKVRLGIGSFYRAERSQVGLDLDLVKDTTLDSQLEETGWVFDRSDRFKVSASPNWAYNFSPRTRLDTSYRYTNVDYSNTDNSGAADFHSHSGRIGLTRRLNERADATLATGLTRTKNDFDVKSTYAYIQAGGSYRFDPTLSGSLFAGVRRTETEYTRTIAIPIYAGPFFLGYDIIESDTKNDDLGYIFSASLSKRFLRADTSLSASRDISNSASGFLLQVTRINWDSEYRFSERLSGNLELALYKSETSNSVNTNRDREYYRIKPAMSWAFTRSLRLSGSYEYTKQTYETSSEEAVRNAAYLTLRYQWPKIAVSR